MFIKGTLGRCILAHTCWHCPYIIVVMLQLTPFGLLGLAAVALGELNPPYYANLTWQPARTLSNWSNLTVETRTGTFIGMLNDTYPDVRQFLRVPFAQVRHQVPSPSIYNAYIVKEANYSFQPPVGDLRWLPPQRLSHSSKKIDSTRYGPGRWI